MVRKHAIRKISFDKGFRGDFTFRIFFSRGAGGDFLRFEKFFEVRLIVRLIVRGGEGGVWPKCHTPVRQGKGPKMAKKRQLIFEWPLKLWKTVLGRGVIFLQKGKKFGEAYWLLGFEGWPKVGGVWKWQNKCWLMLDPSIWCSQDNFSLFFLHA